MKEAEYYLNGIRSNDINILNEIYDTCSKPILTYVKKNSGSDEDAWDVFQDGLLVVYKKVKNNDLTLTAGFGTYLYSVCKYIWLQKLNKKQKEEVTFNEFSQLTDKQHIVSTLLEVEKQKIFDKCIAQMSKECLEILQLYFLKVNAKDISKKMNYSIEYVKRKKYKCKKKLISLVKMDSSFKELYK